MSPEFLSTQSAPGPGALRVSFAEALRFWAKLGCISFGGPSGQIAIMHEEVVERRRWITEGRFLHALNFCMLLPGPEAQQLATYLGWLMHGTRGAVTAGLLFILPSSILLFGLSWIYVTWGAIEEVAAAFRGLRPAVVALVLLALVRIGRRALRRPLHAALALGAFAVLFSGTLPFPGVVALGFFAGMGLSTEGTGGGTHIPAASGASPTLNPEAVSVPTIDPAPPSETAPAPTSVAAPGPFRPQRGHALRLAVVFTVLGLAPFLLLRSWRGGEDVLVREAEFFTQAALVTFGGAYAVLPYVAERAVEDFSWVTSAEMMDGLGLAETTPGPLIMVLQFVGSLAGFRHAADLGLLGGFLGGAVATYFTFLPSFAFILIGAPWVERIRGDGRIAGGLSGVTACVVGGLAALAFNFTRATLFPGGLFDGVAFLLGAGSLLALGRFRGNVPIVVLTSAGLAFLAHLVLGRAP